MSSMPGDAFGHEVWAAPSIDAWEFGLRGGRSRDLPRAA
jgi:hypothetical protein